MQLAKGGRSESIKQWANTNEKKVAHFFPKQHPRRAAITGKPPPRRPLLILYITSSSAVALCTHRTFVIMDHFSIKTYRIGCSCPARQKWRIGWKTCRLRNYFRPNIVIVATGVPESLHRRLTSLSHDAVTRWKATGDESIIISRDSSTCSFHCVLAVDMLHIKLLLPQVRIDGAYIIGHNLCQRCDTFSSRQMVSELDGAGGTGHVPMLVCRFFLFFFKLEMKYVPEAKNFVCNLNFLNHKWSYYSICMLNKQDWHTGQEHGYSILSIGLKHYFPWLVKTSKLYFWTWFFS